MNHLSAQYMTWHDSLTGETVYFAAPLQQYLQNKLDAIKAFIGPKLGAKLMEDIYRRIVEG